MLRAKASPQPTGWALALATLAERQLPRILTQACRDPTSPCFGCFDRDWWHYRIRDFPSIILQQGAYTIWLASQRTPTPPVRSQLEALAKAGARFWNQRATRFGAFEEYYPWERGYPPLAFSMLAIAKLVQAGVVSVEELEPGFHCAAKQLLNRFEGQAANQQIAGLAALAILRLVAPSLVPSTRWNDLVTRSLRLQNKEGWFHEYDGPDLGYLSVTLDCLWDLFDATQDERFVLSAKAATQFTLQITGFLRSSPGMHNARNTDYLVPYGLVRSSQTFADQIEGICSLPALLFDRADQSDHFFAAIDDRYWTHYIGHSVERALSWCQDPSDHDAHPSTPIGSFNFPAAGYVAAIQTSPDIRLFLSLKKGGILTLTSNQRSLSDYGWQVRSGTRFHVSHWWSTDWRAQSTDHHWTVEGWMFPHREILSTPHKHAALRLGTLILGARLIPWLKRKLIFKQGARRYGFRRSVSLQANTCLVEDEITGLQPGDEVTRAPRASKRHVSSADSFHREDLTLAEGWTKEENPVTKNGRFFCRTIYRLAPS